jgi:hypothetical protein
MPFAALRIDGFVKPIKATADGPMSIWMPRAAARWLLWSSSVKRPSLRERSVTSSVTGPDMRDLAQMLAHVHDTEIGISEGPDRPTRDRRRQ